MTVEKAQGFDALVKQFITDMRVCIPEAQVYYSHDLAVYYDEPGQKVNGMLGRVIIRYKD